jgi:hypothetical protein
MTDDFSETIWGKSPGIVTERTPVNVGEDEYMVLTGPRLIIVKRRSMIATSKGTKVPAWITVTNVDEISRVLDRMPQ